MRLKKTVFPIFNLFQIILVFETHKIGTCLSDYLIGNMRLNPENMMDEGTSRSSIN